MKAGRAGRPRRGVARAPAGQVWVEVRAITSPAAAEAVGALLWDLGVGGIAEDRLAPGAVRLRCYLAATRANRALSGLRSRIRALAGWGLDPGRASVTTKPVAARGWARAWRMAARPVRLGRLVVAPTRVRVPRRAGRIVIRVDPGMAFGSGAHPSTRLCLRALLRHVPGTGRPAVLDVGTGSGILAIAAAKLGARVWARDVDPVAIAVARRNIRDNAVGDRVRVVRGEGLGPSPARCQVIVANLVAEAVMRLLPAVPARLRAGGVFIGSGIVADRLTPVLESAAASGLRRIAVLASGAWRAVILARGSAPCISRRSGYNKV